MSDRASVIADIRAWRDQTADLFGVPHKPTDSALACNNKGWWRDVDTLLQELDALASPDSVKETQQP